MAVTQSTILRSPVLVLASAGWSRSTPESSTPIVTPRPSASGCAPLKATAPVSCVGRYGLTGAVREFGPVHGVEPEAGRPAGSTCGSGTERVSSRSIACTPASLAAART